MRSPNRNALLLTGLALTAVLFAVQADTLAAPPDAGAPQAASASGSGVPLAGRALATPLESANTCAACHLGLADAKLRAPATQNAASVHRDDRIGCVGCHKGDARDPTAGAHRGPGFAAHPAYSEIAAMCGSCHSDAGFMRHINARLPVGQQALFNLSLHGKLSGGGDTMAPTCSVCHGKHDILPASSPKAPVNRLNVAKLCSGCHSDPKHMAPYQIRTDQFSKWERSVHGEAFKKGNSRAPTCTGCHGAHSATPPEATSVARACGRCHEEELALFEQSPHSKGFRRRGLAPCVACHSNHDVAPASSLHVGLTPDATCTKCHANDEKPLKTADALAGLLRGARDRAAAARAAVARARDEGLHISGAPIALDHVSTAELRLRPEIHTLDPKRMETVVANVEQAVVAVEKLVADAERARKVERRGYYAALALAFLLFATLSLKAWQLDGRRRLGGP